MQMNYSHAICPYCGTGCSVNLVITDEEIAGQAPYHRSPVNRGKLCTRGLHAAKSVSENRILKPLINGKEVSYEEAFAETLKNKDAVVYVSTRFTNELIFLASRLAKEIFGNETVKTLTNAADAKSTATLQDITAADAVLIIGDCMKNLPLSGTTIFTAQSQGAKIYYAGDSCYTSAQADEAVIMEEFAIPDHFTEGLTAAQNPVVVCLAGSRFAEDTAAYATKNGFKFAKLYETNNGRGAEELGCVPSYTEFKNAETVPKSVIIFAECPKLDTDIYEDLFPQLEKVENLIVLASSSSALTDIANVLIPIAGFGEFRGTVTNWEGRVQATALAAAPPEGVMKPCMVIRALSGNTIAYENAAAVFADLKTHYPQYAEIEEIDSDGVFIKEE